MANMRHGQAVKLAREFERAAKQELNRRRVAGLDLTAAKVDVAEAKKHVAAVKANKAGFVEVTED